MFNKNILSLSVAAIIAYGAPVVQAQEDQIEEVIVTGIRASLAKAVDVKRENFAVVDAIVAEDIGKFPDNNVVEALQRVTGVQVTDRGAGEVSTVSIRGLNDVTTTVNGRTIFTAAGRSVALADIPASLLKQVDVYKTRSASNIEAGIAGQIDIKTQRPFDFEGSKVVLSGRAIHQEAADKTDPNLSALFSNRWETGIGEFGALLNVSHAETNYRDQVVAAGAAVPFAGEKIGGFNQYDRIFDTNIWQPGLENGLPTAAGSTLNYNGVDGTYYLARDAVFQNDYTGTRERPAANVSFQWAPNDTSEYLFETFYNGFRNESFNNLLFGFVDAWWDLADKPAPVLFDGTNVIKERIVGDTAGFTSGDFATGKTDSWVYALGGKWQLSDNLNLRSELVYQESEYETEFIAMRAEMAVRPDIWIDSNPGNGIPSWKVVEPNPNGDLVFGNVNYSQVDLTDMSRYSMSTLYDNRGAYSGDALTWTMDGAWDLDEGFFNKVEFGLRYDSRTATDSYRNQDGWCVIDCSFSNYEGIAHINSGFYDGQADIPTTWFVPNGDWLYKNANLMRGNYTNNANTNAPLQKQKVDRFFEIEEDTFNAYIQGNFETEIAGRLVDGQVGVRYSDSATDMTFYDLAAEGHPRSTADGSTSALLPSAVVRFHITDDLIARLAYTETLRRPEFGSLNANIIYNEDLTNVGYGTASGGNPELDPVESQNIDLSLEWYFAPGSSMYATYFTRDIEGIVIDFRRQIMHEGEKYIISQPLNASNGKLDGLELGLIYFPENLPGYLDGLGVQFSYTALDSSQDIPLANSQGEIESWVSRDMFGVSDSSYSAVLAYEKENFGARLSYVWRDDFLNNYEAASFANPLGIYRKAETSLDLQISYDVSDNLTVTFDGTNLTDEVYQSYYQNSKLFNSASSLYSRTFALGVRYSY
ncbi:MAG: TonB-dependent receptor [Cellvibrio sp.]